jgi:hypothetical protein
MQKLQRNYCFINNFQIVCKHTKNELNKYIEENFEEEQCGFRKEEDVQSQHSHSNK